MAEAVVKKIRALDMHFFGDWQYDRCWCFSDAFRIGGFWWNQHTRMALFCLWGSFKRGGM
jgi:hypothetical protein